MADPPIDPAIDSEFPCSLTIDIPLPNLRLATIAMKAIGVDAELSPLVRRSLDTVAQDSSSQLDARKYQEAEAVMLRATYKATTNRMLRVAVNSFMDSVSLVLDVMEHLDEDVLEAGKGAK